MSGVVQRGEHDESVWGHTVGTEIPDNMNLRLQECRTVLDVTRVWSGTVF